MNEITLVTGGIQSKTCALSENMRMTSHRTHLKQNNL